MNTNRVRLSQIEILVSDIEAFLPVYSAICGATPSVEEHRNDEGISRVRFQLAESCIDVVQPLPGHQSSGKDVTRFLESNGQGIYACSLVSGNPEHHIRALRDVSTEFRLIQEADLISVNGVQVRISRETPAIEPVLPVGARLDHFAVRVRNLYAGIRNWAALTGSQPVDTGIHPVSKGAFRASRLLFGNQMIELIEPVPGMASVVADRLASHGEGIHTLALVASNLTHTIQQLDRLSGGLIQLPPHIFVHPSATGGVLIQLTPRVNHG
jgi:hypothetical protein